MARDGKITDRPVETRQSKAVEDQKSGGKTNGRRRNAQPQEQQGRQGPPPPRARVSAPKASPQDGFIASAMAEYYQDTAPIAQEAEAMAYQRKAAMKAAVASAPEEVMRSVTGMAAGRKAQEVMAGKNAGAVVKGSSGKSVGKVPTRSSGATDRVMAEAQRIASRDMDLDLDLDLG